MQLLDLYNDKELLKDVKDYLTTYLEDEVVRLVFESDKMEDELLRALPITKKALEAAFDNLDLVFQAKKDNQTKVINNPSR